ncbi:GTP cyclohydrolase 1 type 2/Nif3 [Pyronema omphalodes]|nr:GTP cyclohydrolase 1 type 2/Nif3 [Pyronema omphalodes]
MSDLAAHPIRYPTLTSILPFLTTLLTSSRSKFPLIYHQLPPSSLSTSSLDPRIHTVLLALTPHPRVYQLLQTHRPEILFLHHPWKLDRSKVPEETIVVASHEAFDDRYTTGWNTALAKRLGVGARKMVCLKGHKGEMERKIGLVGWFPEVRCAEFVRRVKDEFGGVEEVDGMLGDTQVDTLACLNAFTAEIIERVMAEAPMAKGVVVVTGERKEAGLKRAKELGVKAVVCVGHKRCEVWGLHYVAEQIRNFAENELGTIVTEE